MVEKDELRLQALQHRNSIHDGDEDIENSVRLFNEAVPVKSGQVVAAYWPMGSEFDVTYIMEDLFRRGITVALPVAQKGQHDMVFSAWDGKDSLVKGDFGIYVPPVMNPVEPDILLIPLLAFDQKGNRLGRGAGHYDATLAALRLKRDILAVGVGYAGQAVLFSLPIEPHDQRLDMMVTPNGVFDFRK